MQRRIRICYVINAFAVGGAESVALNLASGLPRDRYDVMIVSVLDPEASVENTMKARCREAGIKIESHNFKRLSNPLNFMRFLLFLRRGKWDIIHGHNRPSDGWAVLGGKFVGVPHRLWTRHLVYRDMSDRQLSRYRRLSRTASMVFAVSDAVRENCVEYERIAPEKVVTMVNGIDTERFTPLDEMSRTRIRATIGCPDDRKMVLFVGRLTDQKAPEGFVNVIGELNRRGYGVNGYMCGDGPLRSKLEYLVESVEGVELLGLRDDVPELLAASDLFVSTSRNEGLPLNVMEAMSCGTPFVGPAIEQISCLCRHESSLNAGLYGCPPETGPIPTELIHSWADTIARLLGDPEILGQMGRLGRGIIESRFSLNAMVYGHDEFYRRICGLPSLIPVPETQA